MLNKNKYDKLFGLGKLPGIKPVLTFFILFLFSFKSEAQENLVPNGSFEEYYSCPESNDLNNGQFELCKYWWKPTLGTPDYFNRCNNGVVGVPNNFWGYQEPYDGDGYVGMVPISINATGSIESYEYIQTQLTTTLKPCYQYYFSMYVCMANYSTHSLGRLGAVFSNDTTFNNFNIFNNLGIISSVPQIVNNLGTIDDSSDWVKIAGYFTANGNENFLTIGYFYDNVIKSPL
jgi:OOP family OmpA-OmpF porin